MKNILKYILVGLLLITFLAGCSNTNDLDNISEDECQLYNPDLHGKFVSGIIQEIDKGNKIITIENYEKVKYNVKFNNETIYVNTSLDKLGNGQSITILADNFEDGVTDINAKEIQSDTLIDPDEVSTINNLNGFLKKS